PPPWRASSAPKMSRARAKELTDRLTVTKWPPRKPYSAKNLLDELKKVQQQQKARSTPAAAAMSAKDQRLYCEDLAKPIPKPPRYRQRHRCRKAYSPVMVATQRASVQRLSRPRSAPLP
ncbi:pknB, partial [Symbiodinium sp. CCMP2456]